MEVFRDLFVNADAETMAATVDSIERSLPPGWTRDRSAEERAQAFPGLGPQVVYCFACTREERRPAALLVLAQKDSGTFNISNIIPSEQHQLSPAEYNSVLEDFYGRVFRPCTDRVPLTHTLTDGDEGPENWLSGETASRTRFQAPNGSV